MKQINAWGKLNRQGESHSLMAHMLDVAACFYAIAQVDAVRRALELVAGRYLTDQDWMRLTVFAFLHDVGRPFYEPSYEFGKMVPSRMWG